MLPLTKSPMPEKNVTNPMAPKGYKNRIVHSHWAASLVLSADPVLIARFVRPGSLTKNGEIVLSSRTYLFCTQAFSRMPCRAGRESLAVPLSSLSHS